MPRPSLKDQRSREILDAFVTCVARYGLDGATQERIAAVAGVQRTLLRHYLGNRDQMVAALRDHVVRQMGGQVDALQHALTGSRGIDRLIDLLFDPQHGTAPDLAAVYQTLVASIPSRPGMRSPLMDDMDRLIAVVSAEVRRHYPGCSVDDCGVVARGIVGLYLSCDALAPLTLPGWRTALKTAATALANTLEDRDP